MAEPKNEVQESPPRMSVASRQPEMVTVVVGAKRTKYILHKSFLTHHSEYFRKALNGPWKESEDRLVVLDDVESCIFDIFVDWIYSGQLPSGSDWITIGKAGEDTYQGYEAECIVMFKTYTLGDRLLAPRFRGTVNNATVNYIIDDDPYTPNYALPIFAFNNLPDGCPIQRALVDLHCRYWEPYNDEDTDLQSQLQLPFNFLIKVMRRYGEKADRTGDWWQHNLCPRDYHEHETII